MNVQLSIFFRQLLFFSCSCLVFGCSGIDDPPDEPQLVCPTNGVAGNSAPSFQPENAQSRSVKLFSGVSGSAVYLDDNLLLTNWHLAIGSIWASIYIGAPLADDDRLDLYVNDGYDEGNETLFDRYYCIEDGQYRISDTLCPQPSDDVLEWTVVNVSVNQMVGSVQFNLAGIDGITSSDLIEIESVLYANSDLDLAVVRIADPNEGVSFEPTRIYTGQLEEGQQVIVAGYPFGHPTVEHCQIVDPSVEPFIDIDQRVPEGALLSVPSFAIDCETMVGGSSGSPVFDAETGYLLGLVWTSVNVSDFQSETVYVTAASAWLEPLTRAAARINDPDLTSVVCNATDSVD